MRSYLAVLCVLAGAFSAAAQTPTSDWVFAANSEEIVLAAGDGTLTPPADESPEDHTLRPWPIKIGAAAPFPYLGSFEGEPRSGVKFSPSFRVISRRGEADPTSRTGPTVRSPVKSRGATTYRYDMLRGKFTIRRGFGRGVSSSRRAS